MSSSNLYVLNAKSTSHFAEFRNGWGSAPIAWDHLAAKYIAEKPAYSMDRKHLDRVWALADDERLEHHERVVLMMTFDRSFVPLHALAHAADACERFGRECDDGRSENHWPAIGAALREAASQKLNRHARGICLSCTSVSDVWIHPTAEQLSAAWPIYAAHTPATLEAA